jgi:hypothetical protein
MGISTVAAWKKGSTEKTSGLYRPNRAGQCGSIVPAVCFWKDRYRNKTDFDRKQMSYANTYLKIIQ